MSSGLTQTLHGFNAALERRMFIVIFAGIAVGWVVPPLAVLKSFVPMLFGYMTFATALSISWTGIARVVKYPGPTLLVLVLLHLVMPVTAFLAGGAIYGPSSPFTVGLVLSVIIPVGVTSVIWTGLARGETPLALTLVTLDSLLTPMLLPVSVLLFLGRAVAFDARSLMWGLFWMIVLPTVMGVTLHDLSRGRLAPRWAPVNGPLSKLCLALVVAVNVAAARDVIIGTALGQLIPLLLLLLVQSFGGYLLGYWAGRSFHFAPDRVAAVTFCTGMRNISAGIVIALAYFSPATAVPVVMAMLFQQPLASVFHGWMGRKSAGNSVAS